jgi:hypothetical protein
LKVIAGALLCGCGTSLRPPRPALLRPQTAGLWRPPWEAAAQPFDSCSWGVVETVLAKLTS